MRHYYYNEDSNEYQRIIYVGGASVPHVSDRLFFDEISLAALMHFSYYTQIVIRNRDRTPSSVRRHSLQEMYA